MNVNSIGDELYTKRLDNQDEAEETPVNENQEVNLQTDIVVDSTDEEAVLAEETQTAMKSGMSKEKAEKKLEKAQKKLEKLEEKLANTDSEKKMEKYEKKIEKIQNKIDYYEGFIDLETTGDKNLDKLNQKKYKLEFELGHTDSEKKQAKLEAKIEKLDAKIEEKETSLGVKDDADENTDGEKAGSSQGNLFKEDITPELQISSDSKLQGLYNELYDLEEEYNDATTAKEIADLEEKIDELEKKIEARIEELENADTDEEDTTSDADE